MELFDIIGNISKPLFRLILNSIKEVFYLKKLISQKTFFGDRPPFDIQSWNIFIRLAAMFGIHDKCCFMETLTLLGDVIFDKVNVKKTFFLEIDPFDMQSWDVFARLTAMLKIHCRILYETPDLASWNPL